MSNQNQNDEAEGFEVLSGLLSDALDQATQPILKGSVATWLYDGGEAYYQQALRLEHSLGTKRNCDEALQLYELASEAGHPLAGGCYARLTARMPKIQARARVAMTVREKLAVISHQEQMMTARRELEEAPSWLEKRRLVQSLNGETSVPIGVPNSPSESLNE